MRKRIDIVLKPDWISYDDIHNLLFIAHENNRNNGFHVKTADMDASSLEEHIGLDGECYVALDGEKLVGVTAVRIVERNNRYSKGPVAAQILSAIHPDYQGQGISSSFHERVIAFAKKFKLTQIEGRVASKNTKIQKALLKWGFRYVDFVTYSNIDHYTIVMLKWLDDTPISDIKLKIHYIIKKIYVIFRFRPGKIKRFGI